MVCVLYSAYSLRHTIMKGMFYKITGPFLLRCPEYAGGAEVAGVTLDRHLAHRAHEHRK